MIPLAAIALFLAPAPSRADTGLVPSDLPPWDGPPEDGAFAGAPRGRVTLTPDRFPAHTKVTLDYLYTAGPGGLDPGDGVRIEDPILHGMRWAKYGVSQLSAAACTPLAEEGAASISLVSVSSDSAAVLGLARSVEGGDIHAYGYTDVWIEAGRLEEGEQLRVRFGDPAEHPDCGHQTPDRAFSAVAWRAFEAAGGALVALDAPSFDVLAQPEPVALHAVLPSYVAAGEPARLRVALLDTFGNPVPGADLYGAVEAAYGGTALAFGPDSPGWLATELTFDEPGVHRVALTAGALATTTNPVVVTAGEPERLLFWGDLHAHHGHTVVHPDGAREDENHAYAQNVAGLDVGCESMKLPPWELGGEALWEELRATCAQVSEDGRYLSLMGFEWMGGVQEAGHHNVYFDDCDGFLVDYDQVTGLAGADGLLERVAAWEAATGGQAVVLPHASVYTGAEWRTRDALHRAAAEIFSGWGDSLDPQVEGSVVEALQRGQHLAFFASTDDHDGWLGNPRGLAGEPAGLAAFWAPALTRADVFAALAGRQVYATTGARVVLDAWLEVAGERVRSGPWVVGRDPAFGWEVHGTAPIARIALRGVIPGQRAGAQDLLVEEPGTLDAEGSWPMEDWGHREWAVWLQVDQTDGQRAWSSPLWLTASCAREGRMDPAGRCVAERPDPVEEGCQGCASAPGEGALAGWLLALGAALSGRRPSRRGRPGSR
ncbi:MAG: DUF3604 domain-containing protein [Pseudomonadota bacterium]